MDNPQVNTNSNQGASTSVRTTGTSPIQSAALDYLLSDSAVSSLQETNSSIINRAEQSFQNASRGAEATRDFQKGRAEMQFAQDADSLVQNASANRLAMRESRGIASSMAQFQVFDDTINKQMNNLKLAKEDALRAADMNYYTQIQNAEMNLINTQLKATEQMMNQMFGIAGITQSQQQIQLAQESQAFKQEQAVGSIALEFGLQAIPGESLTSAIDRAFATGNVAEDRKLKLQQIRAGIAADNARVAQINNEIKTARDKQAYINSLSSDDMLSMMNEGYTFAQIVGDSPNATTVQRAKTAAETQRLNAAVNTISSFKTEKGFSRAESIEAMKRDWKSRGMNPDDPAIASIITQAAIDVYGGEKAPKKQGATGLPGLISDIYRGVGIASGSIIDWSTGNTTNIADTYRR